MTPHICFQIFIGFVLKQLELIEEGQISQADILIPSIFEFLVLLSYEKHHSKPIIDMPKILQLCEGLFASGQAEQRYDLFLFILHKQTVTGSGLHLGS